MEERERGCLLGRGCDRSKSVSVKELNVFWW